MTAPLILAGCTTSPTISNSPGQSVTPTNPAPMNLDDLGPPRDRDPLGWAVRVVQDQDNPPTTFVKVTTLGSGSCPTTVKSVTAASGNWLHIEFQETPNAGVCTDDLRTHTERVLMPKGINLFAPITAALDRGKQSIAIAVQVPGKGIQQGDKIS